jgi:hypothetical protein
MIENNRALSVARASGLGIFRSRDYGPKAVSVNEREHTVAAMPVERSAPGPRTSTARVDNFVGNPAQRAAKR